MRKCENLPSDPSFGIGARQQTCLAILDGTGPCAQKPSELSVATEELTPCPAGCTLYTPGTTGNPLAQDFIQLRQSQAGQNIVAQSGFSRQNALCGGSRTGRQRPGHIQAR